MQWLLPNLRPDSWRKPSSEKQEFVFFCNVKTPEISQLVIIVSQKHAMKYLCPFLRTVHVYCVHAVWRSYRTVFSSGSPLHCNFSRIWKLFDYFAVILYGRLKTNSLTNGLLVTTETRRKSLTNELISSRHSSRTDITSYHLRFRARG